MAQMAERRLLTWRTRVRAPPGLYELLVTFTSHGTIAYFNRTLSIYLHFLTLELKPH